MDHECPKAIKTSEKKSEDALLSANFIEKRIIADIASKSYPKIRTRFPPEPNGYLHLGHAKSIFFNFGLAEKYDGECNLRFDDTNPSTEEQSYVDMIQEDLRWLGVKWTLCAYASDYFSEFYNYAVELIQQGCAYVDERDPEAIRHDRGNWHGVGRNSPYRERSVAENLAAFEAMKAGKFSPEEAVLRAKIDMSATNILLRDPILYRIKFVAHHQTGQSWVIFPTYDFAHCLSDAIEGISHSICTLEFQDNRVLYDWILDHLKIQPRPYQHEFARLNMQDVTLSKRKLIALVEKKCVEGWDDPRMPTLSGLRRKGYPPEALKLFCQRLGISKQDNCVELAALESCVREVLNDKAIRAMGVVDPIKLILRNLDPGQEIKLSVSKHPFKPECGKREIVLTRELYISRKDFQEALTPGYKRLTLGGTVRLRHACVIRAEHVKFDAEQRIVLLEAEADLESIGQISQSFQKPKGVIHWVSCEHATDVEFRKYGPLFLKNVESELQSDPEPKLNPSSLFIQKGVLDRGVLREMVKSQEAFQLEREGYFIVEPRSIGEESHLPVLHETIALKGNDQF